MYHTPDLQKNQEPIINKEGLKSRFKDSSFKLSQRFKQAKFSKLKIISTLVILGGLVTSTILVQNNLDVRRKAAEPAQNILAGENILSFIQKNTPNTLDKVPKFKDGELIIKMTGDTEKKVKEVLATSDNLVVTSKKSINQLKTTSFGYVDSKSGIEKIEPVFKAFKTKEINEGKSFAQTVEETKSKYPNRTKRIPQAAITPNLSNIYKVVLQDGSADIISLCNDIKNNNPDVEYCTPNYIAQILVVPNDPYYSSSGSWGQEFDDLWGLKIISSEQAWDNETGNPSVTVAVVDTGLDHNHPDITDNVWFNLGEDINNDGQLNDVDINGIDDDGNGFVDDFNGWDFISNDNDPIDDHGHGTHVSGTAAGVTNNNIGISGVSWSSKIMAVKGLDHNGSGGTDELANSLIYAADNGADVINNSWGGYADEQSAAFFQDIINYAHSLGAVVVAAAGNSFLRVTSSIIPAGLENVITVAATNVDDSKAYFSNWGELVDVSAPGVNILSLRASGTSMGGPINDNYTRASGTSMSSPHVAGLAALVISRFTASPNEEIIARIIGSTDHVPSNFYIGAGRINAYSALTIQPRANINMYNYQLDDLTGGNGDNSPDPGETVKLIVYLENSWSNATGVEALFSIDNPFITINKNLSSFGDIAQGQTADNSNEPFEFTLSSDTPLGTQFEAYITVTDSGGYQRELYLIFTVTPFIMLEGAEPVRETSATEGISWIDYDNDGYDDIFLATRLYTDSLNNILYRNNGDETFTKIENAGDLTNDITNSLNGNWADYDNDGESDLFITSFYTNTYPDEKNILYKNNGDGTLTRKTSIETLIPDEPGYTAAWGDYDNDGYIDIFMTEGNAQHTSGSSFYHNNGNGTFYEVENSPLNGMYAFSGSWGDYDNDGYLDLFVAFEKENNRLYHNNGDGTFSAVTDSLIANDPAYSIGGSWADYDNDGYLDLFVANPWESNFLYHNNGDGTFTKINDSEIASVRSYSGTWADYDNDGFIDLFANNIVVIDKNYLFRNNGNGTFTKIEDVVDINNSTSGAWGDYNKDGFLDLFVSNFGPRNYLFKNKGNNNNWISFKLVGIESNTSAIGARVRLKSEINGNTFWQTREVSSKVATYGQNSYDVEFGLGDASTIDEILIEWPSGLKQVLKNVQVNQFLTIKEKVSEPSNSEISGTVNLQGRDDNSGANVTVWIAKTGNKVGETFTNNLGEYSLSLVPGTYDIRIEMERYLDAEWFGLAVGTKPRELPLVKLLGGDVSGNDIIDVEDLQLVEHYFNRKCQHKDWYEKADINNDCVIDILDLSGVGSNMGKTSPVPWGSPETDVRITGNVDLQGRDDNSGALIEIFKGDELIASANTDQSGLYSMEVQGGRYSYDVKIEMERYLDAEGDNLYMQDEDVEFPLVKLLGGDTNDDDIIDDIDLNFVSDHMNLRCGEEGWDSRADINNDCWVNIQDLSGTGGNMGKTSPVAW